MHFGVRETAAVISAGAMILCCSCEKHHLGEDPEAQKEHVDVAPGGGEDSGETKSPTESPAATASPTPVNFFPENSPSP
jgi:hypothetical protein